MRIERVPSRSSSSRRRRALGQVRRCVDAHAIDWCCSTPPCPLGLLGPRLGRALRRDPPRRRGHRAGPAARGAGRAGRRAAALVGGHLGRGLPGGRRATGRRRDRRAPVVEVPPGVDTARHRAADGARNGGAARARLGLPAAGPLVVSLSRLVPRKGMDVLDRRRPTGWLPPTPTWWWPSAATGRELARLQRQAARQPGLGHACSAGSATRTGPPCSARPTSSSWPAATVGWGWSRRGSASSSSRRPRPACPRWPATAAVRPRRWSDGVTGLVVADPEDPGGVAEALRQPCWPIPSCASAWARPAGPGRVASFDYDVLASRLAGTLEEVAG